ncbi:MAG: hypothetical protein WDZ46_05245 [Solirubrobacterales bacterium]
MRIVDEFFACDRDEKKIADLYARRPILEFVVKRLIDAINRSVPAG